MDYAEQWLQAMKILADESASQIAFDKTVIGVIVDDTDRESGAYTIEVDNVKFIATSENTTYSKGTSVYVLVPQGDYSKTKTITGKYTADPKNDPVIYGSPLDDLMVKVEQIIPGSATLYANSGIRESETWSVDSEVGRSVDAIGVKANFTCLLDEYDIIQGTYGLRVVLTLKNGTEQTLFLDSALDFFGDPYAYPIGFPQEQAFRLAGLSQVTKMSFTLYQSNDFKYKDAEGEKDFKRLDNSIQGLIKVDNIRIIYAYDSHKMPAGPGVILYTDDDKEYGREDAEREVTMIWSDFDKAGNYLGYTNVKSIKLECDSGAGYLEDVTPKEWMSDENNDGCNDYEGNETQTVQCFLNLTHTNVRVTVTTNDGSMYMDELEFTNRDVKTNTFANLGIKLFLDHSDNSQDSYPFYDDTNQLIVKSEGYKEREVKLAWTCSKGIITEDWFSGSILRWRIPEDNTMLLPYGSGWQDEEVAKLDKDGNVVKDENGDPVSVKTGFKYYEYRFVDADNDTTVYPPEPQRRSTTLTGSYKIKDYYITNTHNNFIECEVTLPKTKGDAQEAVRKNFIFSSLGNSGTDYTLNILRDGNTEDEKNRNADIPSLGTPWSFKAILHNPDGSVSNIIPTFQDNDNKNTITITLTEGNITSGEYPIITAQATVVHASRNVTLVKEYPPKYSQGGQYWASIPDNIFYDAHGAPISPQQLVLTLFNGDGAVNDAEWAVMPDENTQYCSYNTDTRVLSFAPMYIGSKKITVYARVNDEIVYATAILIRQDKWGSSILNAWDGKTQVNDEYILSAAGAFGTMNDTNQFDGVVVGELAKIYDEVEQQYLSTPEIQSGVFGYNGGARAFYINNNGDFFIGKRTKERDSSGKIIKETLGSNLSFIGGKFTLSLVNDADMQVKDKDGNMQTFSASIEASAQGLISTFKQETIGDLGEETVSSKFQQQANRIDACVLKEVDGKETGMGWNLTDTAFIVYSAQSSSPNGEEDNIYEVKPVLKVDNTGLTVTGSIEATSLTLGPNVSISQDKVSGLQNDLSDLSSALNYLSEQDEAFAEAIKDLKDAIDNKEIIAPSMEIITEDLGNGITKTETYYDDALISTTYTVTSGDQPMVFTNVGLGTDNHDSTFFQVSTDGLLQANNAIIHGTIYANEGYIGGWALSPSGFLSDDWSVYENSVIEPEGTVLYSQNQDTYTQVGKSGDENSWRILAGRTFDSSEDRGYANFGVTSDGNLYATGAYLSGEIHATSGVIEADVEIKGTLTVNAIEGANFSTNQSSTTIGNWTVQSWGLDGDSGWLILCGTPHSYGTHGKSVYMAAGGWNNRKFMVDQDGVLYATDAEITGSIKANSGTIGNWYIGDGLQKADPAEEEHAGVQLKPDGIYVDLYAGEKYSRTMESSWSVLAQIGELFMNMKPWPY